MSMSNKFLVQHKTYKKVKRINQKQVLLGKFMKKYRRRTCVRRGFSL